MKCASPQNLHDLLAPPTHVCLPLRQPLHRVGPLCSLALTLVPVPVPALVPVLVPVPVLVVALARGAAGSLAIVTMAIGRGSSCRVLPNSRPDGILLRPQFMKPGVHLVVHEGWRGEKADAPALHLDLDLNLCPSTGTLAANVIVAVAAAVGGGVGGGGSVGSSGDATLLPAARVPRPCRYLHLHLDVNLLPALKEIV